MTNAPIGEQIDDPLNDGVELVEDLQDQAGLPTGDRMDVAKIRIEKLNQERQERVAGGETHRAASKAGAASQSYPTAASSPPDATSPARRWAPEYLRCRMPSTRPAGDGAGVPCGGGSADHLLLHPSGHRGKRTGLRNYEQVTRALLGRVRTTFWPFLLWLLSFGAECLT
ncbi:hypothetical protein TcBrA4_0126540 [Trypanosoma cruzi]|nr:hypothetical protein TcBrA4_0126540 [Trypanosoma cruzi]